MPIQFSCPFCGETTLVDEPFAGHTGPCVNCGKLVTVPSARPAYSLQSAMRGMQRGNWQAAAVIGLFVVGLGIALYAFYQSIGKPALIAANQAAAKQRCQSNLRRIGQAILAYEEANGCFPPAYSVDAAGTPLHSWRVLILPYLGPQEKSLYEQININERWDSPQNASLRIKMPKVFASPLDDNANSSDESSYVVIIGAKTMFPDPPASRKRNDIKDDHRSIIMVVEKESSGKSWMDPNDYLNDGLIDYQIGGDIGGNHNRGATVLFADGDTRFLSDLTSAEELQQMTTVAGGETVDLPQE